MGTRPPVRLRSRVGGERLGVATPADDVHTSAGGSCPPLRVLVVSHSFPPRGRPDENIGGMQRVATGLVEAFAVLESVRLETMVLRTSARFTTSQTTLFLLRTLLAIPRHLARREVDVIVFTSLVTASLCVLLKPFLRRAGVRTVAIAHGRDVTLRRFGYQHLVPRILASVSAVFPVSHAVAQECARRGVATDRLFVVPNGISVSSGTASGSRRGAQTAGKGSNGEGVGDARPRLRLLSVGRQVERKGFEWFVRHVLPILPPGVEYCVVGDGPGLRSLHHAVRAVGAEDSVRLLGRVTEDELDTAYRRADLLIMPNILVEGDMEGFGVVALEAGLRGVPVIASDCEGMRDVIGEGVNGHRVEPGDASGFAAVISRYAKNGAEQEELGRTAHAHVRETYAWPVVARKFVTALRQVMDLV
jgi:phosphatidylinositol alpha-1,6-mannosyltransferase